MNFKTFQVYSSYVIFFCKINIIYISKLFKFTVHKDIDKAMTDKIDAFQNFSSLQFIKGS